MHKSELFEEKHSILIFFIFYFSTMSLQTSDIQSSPTKDTHVTAHTTSDGHTEITAIVADYEKGTPYRHYTRCQETGISPTYHAFSASSTQNSHAHEDEPIVGSPVYGDNSRIFFSHHTSCSC